MANATPKEVGGFCLVFRQAVRQHQGGGAPPQHGPETGQTLLTDRDIYGTPLIVNPGRAPHLAHVVIDALTVDDS